MADLTPIDPKSAEIVGTDEWWLIRLLDSMNSKPPKPNMKITDSRRYDYTRREWLDLLWAYHIGEPPLEELAREWAESTRSFLRRAKTGYAGLIAGALLERVSLLGARVVSDQGEPDVDGDDEVRRIIQANGQAINDALEFAAAMGVGYMLVGHGGTAGALLSAEDPRSMMVSTDPVTGEVRAALKLYADEDTGEEIAALYVLDDGPTGRAHQVTFTRPLTRQARKSATGWAYAEDHRNATLVTGTGVPVVVFENKHGRGEAEPHLELIGRIFSGIADRLWAVKYQVFMQRAVIGNLPDVDADGKAINYDEIFEADPGALWRLPPDTTIWESRQIMVNEVLAPVRDDVRELAAASQTPLPTLMAESVNGSAEGATLAREGLSFKAEDRIARWSPAVVRALDLALAYAGKERAELEPMWAPVERLSLSQRMAAGRDAKQAGVPTPGIWSDVMQMPPATVKRWSGLRDDELIMSSLGGE